MRDTGRAEERLLALEHCVDRSRSDLRRAGRTPHHCTRQSGAREVDDISRQRVEKSGENVPVGTVSAQSGAGSGLAVPSDGSAVQCMHSTSKR